MTCSNCGTKITDDKKRICIHGITTDGSGINIGGKDFVICPVFCSKECLSGYFSNALDAINPKCDTCVDLYSILYGGLSCEDPRCPYVKELADRKCRSETWDRVVKRDGGFIKHVVKTSKKFYLGDKK
jgi:hypothetical protein